MNKKRFIYLLGVFVLIYAAITLFLYVFLQKSSRDYQNLGGNWSVYVNDEYAGLTGDEDFSDRWKDMADPENVIRFETVLPDMGKLSFPTVLLTTEYCAYQAFLDDELIAEAYMDAYESGGYIGTELKLIGLPDSYAGKTMRIVIHPNVASGFVGLSRSWMGSRSALQITFLRMYFFCFISGIFLIFFGGIYLFIVLFMSPWWKEFVMYIPLTVVAMLSGVVLHSRYGYATFFMSGEKASGLYNAALLLLVPAVIICMKSICHRDKRLPISIAEDICLLASVVMICLNAFAHIHLYSLLVMFLPVSSVMIVLLTVRAIRLRKFLKPTHSESLMMASLMICVIGFVAASAVSVVLSPGSVGQSEFVRLADSSLYCVGPVFFGYCMLLDFLTNISAVFAKRQEYDSLTRLAYTDGLTEIPNRAKYVRYVTMLENRKADYCIISMDINNLKFVNDLYGHLEGDKLLKKFSDALSRIFGDNFVARIGGDEFVAVLESDETFSCIGYIRDLKEELERMNSEVERGPLCSVSAGYAFRHESEEDFLHNTYLLADQRMYEDKKQQKEV